MRILIANEGAAEAGGVETYLRGVSAALAERGHQLAWLHHNGSANARRTADCWTVQDLGFERAIARAQAWRPDVSFSHNMQPLAIDQALLRLAPVVKMMHGYFGTCVSSLKSFSWPSRAPCDRRFGQACLAMYFPRRCGQRRPGRMVAEFAWAGRQRALFDSYRTIVVASEHMRAEYVRGGADPHRVRAIPLFGPPVQPGAMPDASTVVFMGRMTPLKGGDLLVRAAADAERLLDRHVSLMMAGDGPERARWAALARTLSVDAVFPGWIDGDEAREILRRAALLVLPSTWPEPFGLVGLEAAAFGVPSVAFDVGGIGEWLRDGDNGLFAGPRPAVAPLASAIARVLGDAGLRARLSSGAISSAREFTIDRHLDALEPLLRGGAVTAASA